MTGGQDVAASIMPGLERTLTTSFLEMRIGDTDQREEVPVMAFAAENA